MKVKATAVMAKELNKALKGIADKVYLEKMNFETFERFVDFDVWGHTRDWNVNTNSFNVIKVVYPPEMYAIPAYITTQDLERAFHNSDRTYEGFIREIRNEYAI